MLKTNTKYLLLLFTLTLWNSVVAQCIDYTNLNSPNVTCTYGTFENPFQHTGVQNNRHKIITQSTKDPYSSDIDPLYTTPTDGFPVVQLGNSTAGGEAESITYTYDVPAEGILLLLRYAVMLQNPNHTAANQPKFAMRITDENGTSLNHDCLDFDIFPKENAEGWFEHIKRVAVPGSSMQDVLHQYKDWTTLGIDLFPYAGSRIKIQFITYDCGEGVHFGYAYFAIECSTDKNIKSIGCYGDPDVTLVAPEGFNYEWYYRNEKNDKNKVQSTDREYIVPFSDQHEYACHLIFKENNDCKSTLYSYAIQRKPIAQADISVHGQTIRCTDKSYYQRVTNTGLTSDVEQNCDYVLWEFGDGTTSTEHNPEHTYANPGDYRVKLTTGFQDDDGICTEEWYKDITATHVEYPITVTVCESDFPYTQGDTIFGVGTTSGTYRIKRIDQYGNDSISVVNLQVLNTKYVTHTVNLCPSELPYTGVNNDTIFAADTQSGTYVLRRKTVQDCDSIVTYNITILEPKQTEFNEFACDSIIWNGTKYKTSGSWKQILKTASGCDSIVTMHLTIGHSAKTNIEITECDNYVWNGETYDKTGTYTKKLKTKDGCDSVVTLRLTIHSSYKTEVTKHVCDTDFPITIGDTLFNIGTESGKYTLHDKTIHGCDSTTVLNLVVRPATTEESRTICQTELPLAWNDTTFGTNTISGSYTIKNIGEYGCEQISKLNLTVLDTNDIRIIDSIFVNTNYANYNFTYEAKQEPETAILTQNLQNKNGCDSTVTLTLHIVDHPFEAKSEPIGQVCAGDYALAISLTYNKLRYKPKLVELKFNEKAQQNGFTDYNEPYASDEISIALPPNIRPDTFGATLCLRADNYEQCLPIKFFVNYSAEIVVQKWNDLLALKDYSQNGGYNFSAYQWYKNNEPIVGETKSYLYVGPHNTLDMTANYAVAVERAGENYMVSTCSFVPTPHEDVQLYPTLFDVNQEFAVEVSEKTQVEIYTIFGTLVNRKIVTPQQNRVQAPYQAGTFVMRLTPQSKQSEMLKIVVK